MNFGWAIERLTKFKKRIFTKKFKPGDFVVNELGWVEMILGSIIDPEKGILYYVENADGKRGFKKAKGLRDISTYCKQFNKELKEKGRVAFYGNLYSGEPIFLTKPICKKELIVNFRKEQNQHCKR